MTFCPEWLIGSPALNTSNALYLWVYLVVSILPPRAFFAFPFSSPWMLMLTNLQSFDLQFMNIMWVSFSFLHAMFDCGRFPSWVIIPVWLMFDAYGHIASSLRVTQVNEQRKVE
jgi:hypothetical protein